MEETEDRQEGNKIRKEVKENEIRNQITKKR